MNSSSEPLLALWFRPLKPSHRSLAEQLVGLGIFLILSFGLFAFQKWIHRFSPDEFGQMGLFGTLWLLVTFLQSAAIWTLWRRHSLLRLKPELSFYISQSLLSLFWSLSFFAAELMLLGLAALLLQLAATLVCTIGFWKKERLSGLLMLPLLAWSLIIGSLNMAICLLNP